MEAKYALDWNVSASELLEKEHFRAWNAGCCIYTESESSCCQERQLGGTPHVTHQTFINIHAVVIISPAKNTAVPPATCHVTRDSQNISTTLSLEPLGNPTYRLNVFTIVFRICNMFDYRPEKTYTVHN